MWLGPVFHFELVRIARRRRCFATRFVFGLILLGVVGINFLTITDFARPWYDPIKRNVTIHELAALGRSLFASIMTAQTVLVLVLTPALVADAIASERHRKTLQDLLTTRLTGGEIVLGKLAARLVNVLSLLALVLPIASLLTLVGGISPEGLLWADLSLVSTAYFLGGLAILASVLSRRSRAAVGSAYFQVGVWVFLPLLLDAILGQFPSNWAQIADAVRAVNDWVWPASPLVLITEANVILGGDTDVLRQRALWMIASQMVYGTVFGAIAAWRLRPIYRLLEGRAGARTRALSARLRWRPRPPCGDDPIYWKEVIVGRARPGVLRAAARFGLPALLGIVLLGMLYVSKDAFIEAWNNGYFINEHEGYQQRDELNGAIRVFGGLLALPWMLWLASLAAASFSAEREQDTWISLLATPLDGAEIIRGKMLGTLRTTAPYMFTIVLLWTIGLASGAIHPAGFLFALAVIAFFSWFVTALGAFFSLRSNTTWRAQAGTLSILVGLHFCCLFPSPLLIVGYAPVSQPDTRGIAQEIHEFLIKPGADRHDLWFLLMGIAYLLVVITIYFGSACLMTRWAFRNFDVVADRPRRRAKCRRPWKHIERAGS